MAKLSINANAAPESQAFWKWLNKDYTLPVNTDDGNLDDRMSQAVDDWMTATGVEKSKANVNLMDFLYTIWYFRNHRSSHQTYGRDYWRRLKDQWDLETVKWQTRSNNE